MSDGVEIPFESLETGPLPDDAKLLQKLVRLQARAYREQNELIQILRERLGRELKHRFGRRSEKLAKEKKENSEDSKGEPTEPPDPPAAARGESQATGSLTPPQTGAGASDPPKRRGHGRRKIPPQLPRDEHLVDLPEEDKRCDDCGRVLEEIDREESCRFDYIPAQLRVLVWVRPKYGCPDKLCGSAPKIAKLPSEPIPKGKATAGFLANLLVNKFADHIPLYRFRKILLRQDIDLPLSTLVDYCTRATVLLKPLWEVARAKVLASLVIGTDDTHVRVRLPGKKGVLKGHLWAYKGDAAHPYVVYEFTRDWRGEAPQNFLATYRGYVQADAYKGYDALFATDERIEVGCWAHARRKWDEARSSSPMLAGEALEQIAELYRIEGACRDMSPDERRAVRQELAAPLLEKLRVWVEDRQGRALPKSALGEAFLYAKNQWKALTRYLEDGRLKIDNNDVERELRAVALGRKNWLACGSDIGGETAAIGYSMMSSAAQCNVEPVEWLTDVLTRIVTCPQQQARGALAGSMERGSITQA